MKKWILLVIIAVTTLTGCQVKRTGYQLTMEIHGEGTVKPDRTGSFVAGTLVTIQAEAAPGWQFIGWEGNVAEPTSLETTIVMDQDQVLRAIFMPWNGPVILQAPGGPITGRPLRPQGEADIQYIMLHAISDAALNPTNPFRMERIRAIFADYGVEAHYVIDREGQIFRFVADHNIARHAGNGSWNGDPRLTNNMNRYSIGIELLGIGTKAEMADVVGLVANARIKSEDRGYTPEQYLSLNILLYQLRSKYGVPPENILSHHAYDPNRKWDPGQLFQWEKISSPLL
ncbi:MAG: hypothetical protein GX971_05965 [Firmicutes bacterium]|nr:hypothetical protein [Bacillota bacterium]